MSVERRTQQPSIPPRISSTESSPLADPLYVFKGDPTIQRAVKAITRNDQLKALPTSDQFALIVFHFWEKNPDMDTLSQTFNIPVSDVKQLISKVIFHLEEEWDVMEESFKRTRLEKTIAFEDVDAYIAERAKRFLTPEQYAVLLLLLKQTTTPDIAAALFTYRKKVKAHISQIRQAVETNILSKFGIRKVIELQQELDPPLSLQTAATDRRLPSHRFANYLYSTAPLVEELLSKARIVDTALISSGYTLIHPPYLTHREYRAILKRKEYRQKMKEKNKHLYLPVEDVLTFREEFGAFQ